MKNIIISLFILFILLGCKSTVVKDTKKYDKMTQNFNKEELLGKWLTNYPKDKSQFIFFKDNGTFYGDNKKTGTYKVKSDSIFLYREHNTSKGRLLSQTNEILYILWGDSEGIKYYKAY